MRDEADEIAQDALEDGAKFQPTPSLVKIVADRIRAYGEQCRRAGAEAMREAVKYLGISAIASVRYGASDERDAIIDGFIKATAEIPLPSVAEAASPAAGWRDINTAPYEDDVTVLLLADGIPELGARDGADWYGGFGSRIDGITHWMPLPSPPTPPALLASRPTASPVRMAPHP